MKATNPLQLMACGILFAMAAAVLLFILALGLQTTPAGSDGLTARTAAIERMNGEIAGTGRR